VERMIKVIRFPRYTVSLLITSTTISVTTISVVLLLAVVASSGYSAANAVVNYSDPYPHIPKQRSTSTIASTTTSTATSSSIPLPPKSIIVETTQRMAAASVNASPPHQATDLAATVIVAPVAAPSSTKITVLSLR
jgi:hypothetical protein